MISYPELRLGIISHVSERKKRHAELIPKLLGTAE